jgi:hypothetical protein
MPNTYAVVVGIEQYQQSGMEGVDYAHADARDFVDVLVERMDVPKENVDLWLDQDATASRFENDLKYNVSRLGRDDRFYFFYAGHGFWATKGGNRLTVWEMLARPRKFPHNKFPVKDLQ